MNTMTRTLLCGTFALLLQSCSTTPAQISLYDFGTAPAGTAAAATTPPACSLTTLQVADVTSSVALDSNLMLYRLAYINDQQTLAFANHRWSMAPAQLLGMRIRAQLVADQIRLIDSGMANPDGWQLRLNLNDFEQYFRDAGHSDARLEVRATLIRSNRLAAQAVFAQQANAGADAPSGAQAMRQASDALIADLSHWLCSQAK